jgi:aromatic ring-opening dioxygenase LigB subunit
MTLVAAAIAPHGFPVIPVLSENADGGMQTRTAMQSLGRQFASANVEAVVIAGPHGIRVDGQFAIVEAARVAGTLRWEGNTAEVNAPCDKVLADAIAEQARAAGLPVARVSYAGNRADQAVAPLDWGGLVPLWFLGHDQNEAGTGDVLGGLPTSPGGPPAVLITPSRSLPRSAMVEFGRSVARAISADSRRIGFIASCDWAHTHSQDGPYGFHDAAQRVDDVVKEAVESNDLASLATLPEGDVQAAAIDGLWQALMLAGIHEVTPVPLHLHSYEAPTYYGMIVASGTTNGD